MNEPTNLPPGAYLNVQDRKSYSNIMPIVSAIIAQLGRPAIGSALFASGWQNLEQAMQKQWNIPPTNQDFVTAMNPLWTAADNSQGDEAMKQLKILMARPTLPKPGQQSQAAGRR